MMSQDADPCIFTVYSDAVFITHCNRPGGSRGAKKVVEEDLEKQEIAKSENHDEPRR